MANQIKGNKIIEDNHLDNAIKSGEEYLAVLKKINAQVLSNAKTLKANVSGANPNSAKGIKEQSAALTESQQKKKAVLKTDQDIIKAEQKLKVLRSDKVQKLTQLKVLAQEQAKINKQLAKESLGLSSAYEKENKKLLQLKKNLRDVILVEGEGSKKAKELAASITTLTTKLDKASGRTGKFKKILGGMRGAVTGAANSVKRLATAFGIFGGLQLAVRGIREMFNIVKDFDQATADLASILGVTTEQMSDLTDQAMELGAATIFTATQVSELQKSYAKLGFTQEEIKGVTEATLELAAATNSDLGTSATVVGSTLRAFGLDVSQTQRVVDVMAKSFSSSALDMEKFTVAMRSVAPVAKNAGVGLEETTALLGTLVNAGVDASTAGTGLRKIFLDLAKSGQTFDEAMAEINNSTNKNATALRLFGQRSAVVGTILAESGVSADALTDKLNNAGGAAKEMADKQLNTLGGAVKLLTSAWEGFILKLNDSSGAGSGLTKVIKFLAENLDLILSTLGKVIGLFGVYKTVVGGATAINNLFGKSVIKNVKGAGLWAAALVLVIAAIVKVVDQLFFAKNANDLFNDTMDKASELLEVEKDKLQLVGIELKNTTLASKERGDVLDKINAEYGTTLKNLDDEAEFARQVAAAYQDVVAQLDKKIKLQVVEEELLAATKRVRELKREVDDLGLADGIGTLVSTGTGGGPLVELNKQKELVALLKGELIDLQTTGKKITEGKGGPKDLADRFKKVGNEAGGASVKVSELNETLDHSAIEEKRRFDEAQQRAKDKADQEKENSDLRIKNAKDEADAIKAINDQQEKDAEAARKKKKKEEAAALKVQKEFAQKTMDLVKQLADNKIAQFDREIEAKNREISISENEISRLQALKTADANESIKAERVKQAKDKIEIERLEKKKKNLLIVVTTLELANNFIQQGDGNGLANASSKMGDFLGSLPTFFDGTEGTVAQALGATGTRDGHTVRVHDNEHILSAKHSDELHAAGLTKNSDIVSSALAYQNNSMNKRAIAGRTVLNDSRIVDRLNRVETAINNFEPVKVVQQHIDLSTGKEIVIDGNKTTKINHRPNTFKI